MSTSAEQTAIELLCNRCYHQCFWLPATADHGTLRVTYATTRNFTENLPIVLFIPGQFCSRYLAVILEEFAVAAGVRMIVIDRPGLGGSEPIPDAIRVKVWQETATVLIKQHGAMSMFCHSAGAVYLLSLGVSKAAFIAPWVPTSESRTLTSTVLSWLPAELVNAQYPIAKAIHKVLPSVQWSSDLIARISSFPSERPKYGCDEATATAIDKLWSEYVWAEEVKAINNEAQVLLNPELWGFAYKDVATKGWAFFAESDQLIGERGATYFGQCLDVKCTTKAGTDHNTVLTDEKGALKEVLELLRENSRQAAAEGATESSSIVL